MTVKECYEQMGSDYEGVLERLGSEAIVKRFALKFLQDPSFAQLKESLAKNDGEEAFRAAHTLKGVCLNLGFDELFEVSAELTEKLRERKTAGSEELFQKVSEKYHNNSVFLKPSAAYRLYHSHYTFSGKDSYRVIPEFCSLTVKKNQASYKVAWTSALKHRLSSI